MRNGTTPDMPPGVKPTIPPSGTTSYMRPVAEKERIVSLDVLRGFALLGILLMNIQSFSMIGAAYFNPSAYGDLSGLNRLVWMLTHLVADTKFISIFSMLFGAGIVLFSTKLESRGRRPGPVHYRRIAGLLIIGLLHGFLLWSGDILSVYALVGIVAYLFWRRSARTLLVVGLVTTAVSSAIYLMAGATIDFWPENALQGIMYFWNPAPAAQEAEIAAYAGSWMEQMSARVPVMIATLTSSFWFFLGWRTGGMMLVGMALYKWSVLSASKSRKFYGWLAAAGLGLGYPLIAAGVARNFAAGWTLEYSFFQGAQFNYWGSFLVALGYIGVVMLIVKARPSGGFSKWLAPVGRMAFTNYLLQTVLMTTVFYGHGLGLFGRVERTGQILIVFAVWAFQIWFSRFWLARFRFGPAEWLWRMITYGRVPPMRRV
ncbi:MAG: DUF418 domain-containing protein [Candidatus Eisenbacteria bacterium]|nr:DUF418 domain-containing protein [Candidatus Eisenbacteria bacterium]